MAREIALVTGAGGEIGHGLIRHLAEFGIFDIVALDLRPLPPELSRRCAAALVGDILDRRLLDALGCKAEISRIFHLAAILSTQAELIPETAQEINVQGTMNLLHLAGEAARARGEAIRFLFPSSIAVYGLPDLTTKRKAGKVGEHEWLEPLTVYGCTKLSCEHLGRCFARNYRQLSTGAPGGVDFRAIRFPGLISAFTTPTGGTSDYAPEMIHAAAQGRSYACFVREDTRIPFMAMPDAVAALLRLADAPAESLRSAVYNVGGFSPSAGELAATVRTAFPGEQVTFAPAPHRQAIVDSWPEDVDDAGARRDWGFRPSYDLDRAFDEYLVPNVRDRYTAR
jgi:nucleoside-diphosphate-sugar epimerase